MAVNTVLSQKESVVVVVDVQERLLNAMPVSTRENLLTQIKVLLQAQSLMDIPLLVTEQYPQGLGVTDKGVMAQVKDAVLIEKTDFSCVRAVGFLDALHRTERMQVVLVGMETHICVLQTALDLQRQGYQVFVVEDAVCARTKLNQYNGLQRLRQAGVVVTSTESTLFEWLGSATHPAFKTLAKLIV